VRVFVETIPLILALYVAGYVLVSALAPTGPQPWLQLPGLVATGAVMVLMLAALGAGILWATTFGAVFARYLAVPVAVIIACIIWVGVMLKCFRDVADGGRSGRLIMAAVGVAATALLIAASYAALDRWRVVGAQLS
jgi:hypothetical protein